MHNGPSGVNVNPGHTLVLGPGDEVLVIAPMDRLIELEAQNQPAEAKDRAVPTPRPPGNVSDGSSPPEFHVHRRES